MDVHRHLKSLALLIFILATYFSASSSTEHPHRHHHYRNEQNSTHFRIRRTELPYYYLEGDNLPESGDWGPWTMTGECSRSCGGGVAYQTRDCYSVRSDGSISCTGPTKRYFTCNLEQCPDSDSDFRSQQCALFNKVEFDGTYYNWVPYTKAPNKCELNCMPEGERFYYRHKKQVIDGTQCDDEKLDVCVNGKCLPVGCDHYLGSSAQEDKCRICGGNGSDCDTVRGILDRNDLQFGYNDLLLIPVGAMNIRFRELRASNNYLAIRNVTGYYYLNGNWRIDFPRAFKFCGTVFHYERRPPGFYAPEIITALGPITEPIYLVILYQERNIGIQYEYSISKGAVKLTDPDGYSWKYDSFSNCSATCGGGYKVRNVWCAKKKDLTPVSTDLCDPALQPVGNQSCAQEACPPKWTISGWSECTRSCGVNGTQNRTIHCEQISSTGRLIKIENYLCEDSDGPSPNLTQSCNIGLPCPKWYIGPWKACDRLCGDGVQRRDVKCYRKTNGRITVLGDSSCPEEKPPTQKSCFIRPCEGIDWLLSDWSGCENKCGLSTETRGAICATVKGEIYPDKFCKQTKLSPLSRDCQGPLCEHQWYASQWSACSSKCGAGVQTRKVFCGKVTENDTISKVEDSKCDSSKKYNDTQPCIGKEQCKGDWYSGPWSSCSKQCGGGQMTRKVLCLLMNKSVDPSHCDPEKIVFASESCNDKPCGDDQILPMEATSTISEEAVEECEEYETVTISSAKKEKSKSRLKRDVQNFNVEIFTNDERKTDDEIAEHNENMLFYDELMQQDSVKGVTVTADTEESSWSVSNGSSISTAFSTDVSSSSESIRFLSSENLSTADADNLTSIAGKMEESTTPSITVTILTQSTNAETDRTSVDSLTKTTKASTKKKFDATNVSNLPTTADADNLTSIAGKIEESTTPSITVTTQSTNAETDRTSVDSLTKTTKASTKKKFDATNVSNLPTTADVDNLTFTAGKMEESTTPSITVTTQSTNAETDRTSVDSLTKTTKASTKKKFDATNVSNLPTTADADNITSTVGKMEESTTPSITVTILTQSTNAETDRTSVDSLTKTTKASTKKKFDATNVSNLPTTADADNLTSTVGKMEESTTPSITVTTQSTNAETDRTSVDSLTKTTKASTKKKFDATNVSNLPTSKMNSTEVTKEMSEMMVEQSTSLSSSPQSLSSSSLLSPSSISTFSSRPSSSSSSTSSEFSSSEFSSESSSELSLVTSSSESSSLEFSSLESFSNSTSSELSSPESSLQSLTSSSSSLLTKLTVEPSSTKSSLGLSTKLTSETSTDLSSELISPISSSTSSLTKLSSKSTTSTMLSSIELSTTTESPSTDELSSTQSSSSLTSTGSSSSLTSTNVPTESSSQLSSAEFSSAQPSSASTTELSAKSSSKFTSSGDTFSFYTSEITESSAITSSTPISTNISSTSPFYPSSTPTSSSSEFSKTSTSEIGESTSIFTTPNISESTFESSSLSSASSSSGFSISPSTSYASTVTVPSLSTITDISTDNLSITSESSTSEISSSSSNDLFSTTMWSSKLEEFSTTEDSSRSSYGTTMNPAISKEMTTRQCKKKKHIPKCESSEFGCCFDGITPAKGPFSAGCQPVTTCNDTKFGCCPDEVTPAIGLNGVGCPVIACNETLYGCCSDGVSIVLGNDNEGCPEPITTVTYSCKTSQFGCCPDGITPASGPEFAGCFECVEGSGECDNCTQTKYGCCPDRLRAATGPDYAGCEEITGSTEFSSPSSETWTVTTFSSSSSSVNTISSISTLSSTDYITSGSTFEITCHQSKYGCCNDNTTEAKGQNFEGCPEIDLDNCTASYFGCCPDGNTTALGHKMEGCKTPCSSDSLFGCCDDNLTPAHGPFKEGCCLNTKHGCCPDNIIAATGPNLEGCSCKNSIYGCCSDNVTSAKGPKNEGCPCEYTEFGCCPNKIQPASGLNYQGCPCYTYQFGCCPDGITQAKGPFSQGCGCEHTEFGCCSDEKTPATNVNRTCTCEASKYGCCPDGVTEAQGENFEKCSNVPVKPSETCFQNKDKGTCNNYTVKWFFDVEYAGCSRFWYGGCGGNANNFRTQEECKTTCIEPPGKEVCYLPKMKGSCDGYFPTWYYDTTAKQCGQFIYGGCLGNNNKFQTREECERLCVEPDNLDACEQEVQPGPCNGTFAKWFYDKELHQCRPFRYGGCKGNANNFLTEAECQQKCSQSGKARVLDVCSLPKDKGPCPGSYPRWYYDSSGKMCKQFVYGGCLGNSNKFESKEDCQQKCHERGVEILENCHLPKTHGSNCTGYMARWLFNTSENRCMPFYYNGCGGNANNFESRDACEHQCPSKIDQDTCTLPALVGECHNYVERWYFDVSESRCRLFYYGGCGGNGNNFLSEYDCQHRCVPQQATTIPNTTESLTTTPKPVIDICDLPRLIGSCDRSYPYWYYDKLTDTCREFEYSGCEGNANSFRDQHTCERRCQKVPRNGTTTSTSPRTTSVISSSTPVLSKICYSLVDPGPCIEQIPNWYFDISTGLCKSFMYGGCEGNANRFTSEEQCERHCGSFQGKDVCNLAVKIGSCSNTIDKWYFNRDSHICEVFQYSGCDGNGNRFSTIDECETVCLRKEELLPVGNATLSRADVCRLPVDSGPCPEGYYKRWFYDEERLTCLPFIYSGCGGNFNRFKTFQKCIDFCQGIFVDQVSLVNRTIDVRFPSVAVEDPCEIQKSDCADMQQRCPYGVEKWVENNGCENCRCYDPCRNPEPRCPPNTECDVDFYRNQQTGTTEYKSVCRLVNKEGECPQLNAPNKQCSKECHTDADCSGDDKCCSDGCSTYCVKPYIAQVTTQTTTTTTAAESEKPPTAGRPPVVLDEPSVKSYIEAPEGNYATLKCMAVGFPKPSIIWQKDGTLIERSTGRYKVLSDGILQIIGLHKTDAGNYICIANNGIGEPARKQYRLVVKDGIETPADIISDTSTGVVVPLGASTVLQCYVYGWPKPTVTWWREDKLLPLQQDPYEQRRDNSLVIKTVILHLLGPYTCQAYNGIGRATSWSVTLHAVGPVDSFVHPEDIAYVKYLVPAPRAPPLPQPGAKFPSIQLNTTTTTKTTTPRTFRVPVNTIINTNQTTYSVGSDLSLPCDVDGYPIPRVTWYKDDIPLHNSERIRISESNRLLITRVNGSDAGHYKCVAVNNFSSSNSTINITVKGVYLHENCTDNPFFANCVLIVKANLCQHQYYAKFCCRSCTFAGQLPVVGNNFKNNNNNNFINRKKRSALVKYLYPHL